MNDKPERPNLPAIRTPRFFFLITLPIIFCSGLAVSAPERAKPDKAPVAITLTLKKVETSASGRETLVDSSKIKPGDLLEYRAVYRNRSKEPVKNLDANLPVPFGLEYVDNSAKPLLTVQATADNSKFDSIPLKRMIKDSSGKLHPENIPFAEYRGLRWVVGELGAGKKTEVIARMRVIELPKTPEQLVKPAQGLGTDVKSLLK